MLILIDNVINLPSVFTIPPLEGL